MRHQFSVRIGPVGFRIGSDWRVPIAQLEQLYADYPKPLDGLDLPPSGVKASNPSANELRMAEQLVVSANV